MGITRRLNAMYDRFEKNPKAAILFEMAEELNEAEDIPNFTLADCFEYTVAKIPPKELVEILKGSVELCGLFEGCSCYCSIISLWFTHLTNDQREALKPHTTPQSIMELALPRLPEIKSYDVIDFIAQHVEPT